ncbi:retrovirus-related pol polyprotein from transposon TNT 1-94 [Tanacetum coccineum]
MGHVLTEVGRKWKQTGRTFTIVGNSCPLTRITSANIVPPKKTTSHSVETQKLELKVYSRKPKSIKNVGSSKKAKIVESKNANHLEPNHTWGSNATDIPLSSSLVMTGCPNCSLLDSRMTILEELWGMVTISWEMLSRIYNVKGIGHNLFLVVQFCNMDLEVAFRKNTCFIRNLEASKTKSWPDALTSINGKRYILVIIDDYLRFTWVRLLRTKDKALEAIIKCIKNIQVRLNATVRNVRTDNGTKLVNQTLHEFYENVGISHQTSVARTPQQNGVVKRQNRTLVEAARTMLIFSKAPLFLGPEAINTAYYTYNTLCFQDIDDVDKSAMYLFVLYANALNRKC